METSDLRTPVLGSSNRLSLSVEDVDMGAVAVPRPPSRSPQPQGDATSSAAQVLRRMSIDDDRSMPERELSTREAENSSPNPSHHRTTPRESHLGTSSSQTASRPTTLPLQPSLDFAARPATSSGLQRPNYQIQLHPSGLPSTFPIHENTERDGAPETGPLYPRLPQFFQFVPEFPGGNDGASNNDGRLADANPRRKSKGRARRMDPDLTGCEVIFTAKAWRKGLVN